MDSRGCSKRSGGACARTRSRRRIGSCGDGRESGKRCQRTSWIVSETIQHAWAQEFEPSSETRLYRWDRETIALGDLARRQIFEKAQQDRGAVRLVEREDRLEENALYFGALEELSGGGVRNRGGFDRGSFVSDPRCSVSMDSGSHTA